MTSIPPEERPDLPSSHEVPDHYPVTIAIVGYRSADDIRTCLQALAQLTAKNFSISICENGGPEAFGLLITTLSGLVNPAELSRDIVDGRVKQVWTGRLLPGGQQVRIYLASSNLGYAGGANVCIRQLGATDTFSAVWFLSPDTAPNPSALAALIHHARQGGYDIVGSRLVLKATQQVQGYGGRWRVMLARGFSIGMFQPQDAVPNADEIESAMDYVLGASLFATKTFIDDVGLMDERYFLYCEEVDWCLRRGHHRLGYAHNSIVAHQAGSTTGSSAGRQDRSTLSVYLFERNGLLLTRRFYPQFYPVVVFATLALTSQFLLAGAFRNFVVALWGWWSGVRGEHGAPPRSVRP
jgi:N-acetylglucosaminyl-diphospho-decaprenol L-rhamnosyltransferase